MIDYIDTILAKESNMSKFAFGNIDFEELIELTEELNDKRKFDENIFFIQKLVTTTYPSQRVLQKRFRNEFGVEEGNAFYDLWESGYRGRRIDLEDLEETEKSSPKSA